ncbi:MAG TPA: MBOAT family O-acyltransferase [Allosphingosinicella sp.]|jgi:D-alanyl-lipoteichoic acid acyltransferase DltB (MBOAT superfamily)
MLTYDSGFIALFLPALLLVFWTLERFGAGARIGVLLGASILFYWLADPRHAPLVASLVLVNFAIGAALTRLPARRGAMIGGGVLLNVAVLAFYKYWTSPADLAGAEAGAGLLQTGLPLGLSFFILKQISWLVDLPAEASPIGARQLPRFALYSVFFPQMVAGPVFRFRDANAEYAALEAGRIDRSTVALGLSVFAMGAAKKLLIADPIGLAVDPLFAAVADGHVPSMAEAWAASWCYLLQLYFDFSGVSDVALGIGLMVGLRLPVNFYSPLKARTATSYFDRWHISLVIFIRTYVFAPLYQWVRRRAKGSARSRTMIATAAATLISLSLVGWWHGARPTYVLSGFLTGLVAVGFQLAAFRRTGPARAPGRARLAVGHAGVILVLMLFLVLFRADSLETAGAIYRSLLGLGGEASVGRPLLPAFSMAGGFEAMFHIPSQASPTGLMIAAAATLIAFAAPNSVQIFDLYDHPGAPGRPGRRTRLQWRRSLIWAGVTALLLALCLGQSTNGALGTTIYARF